MRAPYSMTCTPAPTPVDFAANAVTLSITQLAKRYGVNIKTARKWSALTGSTPPSGRNRDRFKRPMPADFAERYATTAGYVLHKHYGCTAKPLARWVALLTDADRAAHAAAMRLASSSKPNRKRPAPRVKVARFAQPAAPKPAKARRITQHGYGRQALPTYVPDTLHDRAAQYLRPTYIPVVRCGNRDLWHVGRYVFNSAGMLAFAVKRGFDDGASWGAGA